MSETVKIVHEDGTVVDGVEFCFTNARWTKKSNNCHMAYYANDGWREVKPEPVDVTDQVKISEGGKRLAIPNCGGVFSILLPPGHFCKKDVGCIQENGKTFATTVLRIMNEGDK